MKVSAKKSIGKRALALLLALLMAVTALSLAASTQAASVGEEGSARVLADNIDTELDALKSNIDTYEEMMDGEHIYKNMETAYEKYCDACEAYYENYYGYEYDDGATVHTQNVTEVTSANSALEAAIETMKPYTGYVGEATTAADGDYTSDASVASSTSASLLMQKDDTSTRYITDESGDYKTNNVEVKAMGDDHDSIEMYDELSGVMYTYGVSESYSNSTITGAGNYGPTPLATSGSRLGSAEMNIGLIYGSVVFLYTGTGEHAEGIQTTDTYAVPINAYVDCAQTNKDQDSITLLGINFESEDYRMNGGAFELHRGWHGWLEYQNHTSYYIDNFEGNYNGSSSSTTSSNKYENHFFGFTEGFGWYSQSSYYSDICTDGATSNNYNDGGGLLYRSHTPDHSNSSSWNNTIYSNTLYYTGDPVNSVANKDTTKTEADNGTYYATYDMLDYIYYNVCGGDSGTVTNTNRRRAGCWGNYWLIVPDRSTSKVTGYYSNAHGSNNKGNIDANTLPTFMQNTQTLEETGTSNFGSYTTTSDNSFASNAQPGGAADSYIYVVDYEPVLDAVDEYMQYTKIADPDSNTYYRYGSENMKAILSAFDTITEYNPNSAFSSNSTTLDVAGTVETVAETLEANVTALETAIENNTIAASEATPTSAAKPLADTDEDLIVQGYDTVSYTIHDMVQTGYDEETGASDKYNFLTEEGQFVTTGTQNMGVYEYYDGETAATPKPMVSSSYEYTTIRGTVGETRATYTVTISRADDDLLVGYEFNSEVFAAYYGATEGAQENPVTGGFLHSVFTSVTETSTEVDGTQAVDYTATITVYAKEAELYAFESARDYQIYYILKDRTNYSTTGSITMTQTDPVTISYYQSDGTNAVPTTFVWQGALYQLSSSDGWGGTGYTSLKRASTSSGDVTYTWLNTSAYHTNPIEVNVYYKRVPVNVVYASYSVIIESGTNSIIGDATQDDGYVQLKGSSEDPSLQVSETTTAAYDTYVTETEEYPVSGPVGATAVPNTNTENGEQASFIRWYLLDKAPDEVSWQDFASATAVSASWGGNETISPNLATDPVQAGLAAATATEEEIIGAWNEDTTYYYYALFTADEPDTSTKHLQVTLVLDDWGENSAVEAGAQFIVNVTDHVSDGLDMDISYVAEIGENGEVTLTFDLLPGTCVVEINTDFAYGYSLVIDTTDAHNQEDGTQMETINTGTEDEHHLTFHLVYNPLNTAENNSDSKTNNFIYTTTGSGTEG